MEEQLQNKEEVAEYVNAALEQYFVDHNKELFLSTLKEAIIAREGITKISRDTHINRQHIYKMLSSKGNPSFDNISSLLTALGLQLKVESQPHHLYIVYSNDLKNWNVKQGASERSVVNFVSYANAPKFYGANFSK